ncbi:MAG: hypothetical protein IPM21_12055 [Acidobacteria bacterium]|nr:hypothetical protein [Acidobacteriota bacterium]
MDVSNMGTGPTDARTGPTGFTSAPTVAQLRNVAATTSNDSFLDTGEDYFASATVRIPRASPETIV